MESGNIQSLGIIVIAVIWCVYFLVCVREINVRWKRIERTSDELQRKNGSKPVMLYIDDDRGAMVTDLIGISIFAPMIILALIATDLSNPNWLSNFLETIAVFILFCLAFKLIVTSWMRKVFIADGGGIEEVRLKARGFKVVMSIRWQDVTSVDVGYGKSPMTITSSKVKMKLLTSLENFEQLFEIMRATLPRTVLSDRAAEFTARPSSTFSLNGETVKIGYSKLVKSFFTIISAFLLLVISIASAPVLIIAVFTILCGSLLMEFFLSYYVLSDEGLERRIFHVKKIFIPWNEIESVKYVHGKYSDAFYIYGPKKKIEIMTWLDGMPQFARMMAAKVPPEKWARSKVHIMTLMNESHGSGGAKI